MTKLFKAGEYYIGDPRYVFNASWDSVLQQTNSLSSNEETFIGRHKVAGGDTAYTDGVYYDQDGRQYAVDSGILAIMPAVLLNKDKVSTKIDIQQSNFMHIVKFENDFEVEVENGVFTFGSVVINTHDESDKDAFNDLLK